MQNNPTRHDTGKTHFRKVLGAISSLVVTPATQGEIVWQPQAGQIFAPTHVFAKTGTANGTFTAPSIVLDNGVDGRNVTTAAKALTTKLDEWILVPITIQNLITADTPLRLKISAASVVTPPVTVPPTPQEATVEVVVFAVALHNVQS